MGRAEDAARRALEAARQQSETNRAALACAEAEKKRALYEKINVEILQAMNRLEKKGFPGVQLFTAGGRLSRRESAYWQVQVGTWREGARHGEGEPKLVAVHSDGTISWPRSKDSVRDFLQVPELEMLLDGLKELGS